jgi:hypothetical protein
MMGDVCEEEIIGRARWKDFFRFLSVRTVRIDDCVDLRSSA